MSYFKDFTSKTAKTLKEIDSTGDNNLGMETDSQANQRNQTEVLLATRSLKQKEASSEQMIVLCLYAWQVTK